jgi:cytochrome c oxidase subunit 2
MAPAALIGMVAGAGVGSCRRDSIDAAALTDAQQTYAALCARCHGADGRGGVPVAGVEPRNFRDAAFQRSRTDAELARVIKQGKGAMPAFGAIYDEPRIAALVQLIRNFR